MTTTFLSSWFNEYNDLNDLPNNGGSVEIYLTGTTTPAAVYADHTGDVANTNPVVFNSQGYPIAPIWLDVTNNYDAIVKDALGNVVYELDYIGLPPLVPATGGGVDGAAIIWVRTLSTATRVSDTVFTIEGIWDVIFSQGRRLKITRFSAVDYSTIQTAVYDSGTGLTTVTVVSDGTGVLPNDGEGSNNLTVYYSALDSINLAVPYISYTAANTGTEDALVVNLNPAVYALTDKLMITVDMGSSTNLTTTPNIVVNGLSVTNIVSDSGGAIAIGSLPRYTDLVYDVATNVFTLKNPATTSNDAKWAAFPVGYVQPFIPQVMGTTLALWLAVHTDWRKLTNTQVPDIEGRAMAVSSATHLGNTQTGADDSIVPAHDHTGTVAAHSHPGSSTAAHTHTITDPGHSHPLVNGAVASASTSFAATAAVGVWLGSAATSAEVTGITVNSASAAITIAADTPTVTVASAGVSVTNGNIQRTQYFDYIVKVA
jgi:hypothetical protein